MSKTEATRQVSNFLFSRANREFLIFLFFFAIAGIFWLQKALNDSYQQELKVLVHYTNIPKNCVMTSLETDTLSVVVADKGISLLPYIYNKERRTINVDFLDRPRDNGQGTITQSELQKMVGTVFQASTKVVSIKPDKLTFTYNNGERKRVPVKVEGHIVPDDLYFIAQTHIEPDSITIYASRQVLDSTHYVTTEHLNVTGFHDTLTVSARLKQRTGVKMVPGLVAVRFATDILTEESVGDIPIVGINMPEGKVLRTFPSKTKVKFVTGMKNYQTLTPKDFLVIADYNEIVKNQSPKCNIYLRRQPEGIMRARLETQQVDYLIEERQP